MKKLCLVFNIIIVLGLITVGIVSLVDTDRTVSVVENRKLASKPEFSISALLDGSYISDLESYYSDTFPMRETLMTYNKTLNGFYRYSGKGENNMLILNNNGAAAEGGVSLDDYENAVNGGSEKPEDTMQNQTPDVPDAPNTDGNDQPDVPDLSDEQTGDSTDEQQPNPDDVPAVDPVPVDPGPTDEEIIDSSAPEDSGWETDGDAHYDNLGAIIIVGDQAMEIPYKNSSAIERYAAAVSDIAAALPDVQVYSLVTPNAAEFYMPNDFRSSSTNQKSMIELCYENMIESVKCVDAYSKLAKRTDQYIYFRTDHHWTARGAYWAYTAFCETAGFKAVSLKDFETGRYDEFVGSLYTWTAQYVQSEALWNNPDYVEYFLPIQEAHAKYYTNSSLTNGISISVVSTNISNSSKQNKYLCFISGDTPICVIETDVVDGGVCVVLKESYGNAFVPFLTSHYSKIIVIDPREFNNGSKPTLDLVSFAQEQGVTDLIAINYPFMINNTTYIAYLERLTP